MADSELVEGILIPSTQSKPPLSTLEPEEKCSFTSDEQVVQDWLADKSRAYTEKLFRYATAVFGVDWGKAVTRCCEVRYSDVFGLLFA